MPDFYAINTHLQERLEQDWREEVGAAEAARWLDKAGLLQNYKNGLPLRRLLRAGRIAGQEQRPNRKNGAWFIRRLTASRDPDAIRDARERLRRCLPIDRDALPPDWPVNQGPAVFWQELGKTVAAFGYLEHILASTCYALLRTGERAVALLEANDHEAMRRWIKRFLRSQTDSMRPLTPTLSPAGRGGLACRPLLAFSPPARGRGRGRVRPPHSWAACGEQGYLQELSDRSGTPM